MSEHTKEPWCRNEDSFIIWDDTGQVICHMNSPNRYANGARIVDSVNACLGIINPATTVPELVTVCRRLMEEFSDASQYKGAHLREKHGDEVLLREAEAVLAKTGQT